jgi:hypothetical protein
MLLLKHPNSGLVKEVPTSFSWTTLFFGGFVPLFRGWYGYGIVCMLVSIFSMGLSNLVYPFFINKHYIQFLLEKGYKPCSEQDVLTIQSQGIMYQPDDKKNPVVS